MKKILLLLILVVVAIAVAFYFYMYKDHRNIADEEADFTITVVKLQDEFAVNDSLSNAKYQDKTIQIAGKVSSIDVANKSIVIDEKLFATFSEAVPDAIAVGKQIKIKGRFLGYDDLVEEFKMDQVSPIE